jgi:NIPSNAP protein
MRGEEQTMKKFWTVAAIAAAFVAGFFMRDALPVAHAQAGPKVFELRTYTAPDGKLSNLHARFRDHTRRIFNKHGMKSVVYFAPTDAPLKDNTLIYILEHPSREEAKKHWEDFQNDPEWKKVAAESQVDGRIVQKVESVFMTPTDYSPMK